MRNSLGRRNLLSAAAGAGVAAFTLSWTRWPARAEEALLVMDWTGYELPELHRSYLEKYGESPAFSLFADLEEAFLKIGGGFQPDLMHADHWQIPQRRDAGLFSPWEVARLRNWPDLMPQLAGLPTLRQGERQWGVPADWGINSICYRADLIEIEEESWNLLWDRRYEGKIATTTQMDNAVGAAALALGIGNPFVDDPAVLARIRAKLEEQKPLLRFYWSDPTALAQSMASGEVAIAFAWPAVYKQLKAEGVPVRYIRPKEGVQAWAEGFLLMKDRRGDEQRAYDYVDSWLEPETGQWLMENYGYGHANLKAFERVATEVKRELLLDDPDAVLSNSFFIQEMSPKVYADYVRMYEEVRAGL